MPNNQELRLQQTQMLSHQDFRSAQAIPSPKQEHHNYTSAQSLPSRAQNRGFCALLPKIFPIFRPFEHKIEVFVRFWGLEPLFSGFSSTKSAFLCSIRGTSGIGKRKSNLPAIHRAYFQNANAS